jgi:hypothetical protein
MHDSGTLQDYYDYAANLPTWTLGEEAQAIAEASFNMPDDGVVVEICAFLGAGTVLLAGARKLRGSGTGARLIFESWAPLLRVGGWNALHNSDEREYDPEHIGNRLIVLEELLEPKWIGVETVHSLTFAQKTA